MSSRRSELDEIHGARLLFARLFKGWVYLVLGGAAILFAVIVIGGALSAVHYAVKSAINDPDYRMCYNIPGNFTHMSCRDMRSGSRYMHEVRVPIAKLRVDRQGLWSGNE